MSDHENRLFATQVFLTLRADRSPLAALVEKRLAASTPRLDLWAEVPARQESLDLYHRAQAKGIDFPLPQPSRISFENALFSHAATPLRYVQAGVKSAVEVAERVYTMLSTHPGMTPCFDRLAATPGSVEDTQKSISTWAHEVFDLLATPPLLLRLKVHRGGHLPALPKNLFLLNEDDPEFLSRTFLVPPLVGLAMQDFVDGLTKRLYGYTPTVTTLTSEEAGLSPDHLGIATTLWDPTSDGPFASLASALDAASSV